MFLDHEIIISNPNTTGVTSKWFLISDSVQSTDAPLEQVHSFALSVPAYAKS